MPRKNRRFTGEDILRLYCRNLTASQQAIVDAVGFGCADMDDEDLVRSLLEALSSPPLSDIIDRLPGGSYILAGIELAIVILDTDTSGIDDILIRYPEYLYDPSASPPST